MFHLFISFSFFLFKKKDCVRETQKYPLRRIRKSSDSGYHGYKGFDACSPKSPKLEIVSPPAVEPLPPPKEHPLSKGHCTTCGEACIDKIKDEHILPCKICKK